MEHGPDIDIGLEFSQDLIDPESVALLCHQFEELLAAGTSAPSVPLSSLTVDARGSDLVIDVWSGRAQTAVTEGTETSIDNVIAERIQEEPHAVAAEFAGTTLTYGELDQRAEAIARRIRQLGVNKGELVAIFLERSFDMVAAVVGILRSGAAYLPLDVAYPEDRLRFMLSDAHARCLITESIHHATFSAFDGDVIVVDAIDEVDRGSASTADEQVVARSGGDLAYVIYTSGSTGRPKGVLVPHRGVVNLARTTADVFGFDRSTRFLQFATLAFDASVLEILVTLMVGGTICLTTRETVASPSDLVDFLESARISATLLPPSLLALMPVRKLPDLTTLLCGGEAVSPDLATRWGSDTTRFYNVYGPTETTVLTTYELIDPSSTRHTDSLPIGRPFAGMEVYVVDRFGHPAPLGCPGELLIGGLGVTDGYLDRADLTADRFVANPFSTKSNDRLYRTGDIVRWLPGGALEHRGRLDDQVKFRGYRIELGEIEQTLARFPSIEEVAVVLRHDGPPQLVGYLVQAPGFEPPSYSELRTYLRGSLPDYMVPSAFVNLDELPRTSNGFKIDRARLPAPGPQNDQPSFEPPSGPVEELLGEAWCDVLDLGRIGRLDDVFSLGANSLDAARVSSKLRAQGIELSLRTIFDHPTIAASALAVLEVLSGEVGETSGELFDRGLDG